MRKARAEKIGVVVMFLLVLVVFSFAERDTQKIIRQQTRTAERNLLQNEPTPPGTAEQPKSRLLTRN